MARLWIGDKLPLTLNIERDWIDATCGIDTLDADWVGTDRNGHEHRAKGGYPTLNYIVDKQHWCDGHEGIYNHDPHMAVDEAHYECKTCGVIVEPGIIPAGTPLFVPGSTSATVHGYRTDGAEIDGWVTEDEARTIPSMSAEAMQQFIDGLPEDRITSIKFSR